MKLEIYLLNCNQNCYGCSRKQQLERLGCNHSIQVDVRVIAATNQNLRHMVQEESFARIYIID